MKTTIKLLIVVGFVFINSNIVFSQLKVESDGSLYVDSYKGNWGRANWTKIHYQNTCAYHLWNTYYDGDVFYVKGNGVVWTRNGYLTASDSVFKSNILTITSPLEKVKNLRGVTYNRKFNISSTISDSTSSMHSSQFSNKDELIFEPKEYGLIAQEVEKVIPEAVQTMHDSTKAVSYQSIIPILIESIKEQQVQIETLKKIIVAHEEEIIQLKKHHENDKASLKSTTTTDIYSNVDNSSNALLFQNKPNPFTVDTEINYNIPIDAKNAFIYIHDLQGIEIKSYCIKDNGAGSIVIKGTELKAGMYVYSLFVNNQIIDTKRMILTQN